MYEFAYKWSREKGQKCLQQDTALGLWRLLFQHHRWQLADDWCEYVEEHHKRAIVQDTWNLLFDFMHVWPPPDTHSSWHTLLPGLLHALRFTRDSETYVQPQASDRMHLRLHVTTGHCPVRCMRSVPS